MGHMNVNLSEFSVLYITGTLVKFWCILEGKKKAKIWGRRELKL